MQSATALAILGLAAWYILSLLMLASLRLYHTLVIGKAANSFRTDGADLPGFGERLSRVHANCFENIPLYMVVLLYAVATGQTGITDSGAAILLYARMAQSLVHAASTSVAAVYLRFMLFAVQNGLLVWWIWQMATGR
jgi:uncharacterized MAPEG superfamily protein